MSTTCINWTARRSIRRRRRRWRRQLRGLDNWRPLVGDLLWHRQTARGLMRLTDANVKPTQEPLQFARHHTRWLLQRWVLRFCLPRVVIARNFFSDLASALNLQFLSPLNWDCDKKKSAHEYTVGQKTRHQTLVHVLVNEFVKCKVAAL